VLVFFQLDSDLSAAQHALTGDKRRASLAEESFGDVLTGAFTSPLGIALQVLMLAGLALLVKVDWRKVSVVRRSRSAARCA
jgi:hypothetical protein